ncbi:glucokinase [Allonocardiopsis opalescens]|uniref:Glucokinase n=1 Tax=Allonocardiopsis opalescens TaxID=1144618 RepID=A0A2T0Q9U4_9ACTN|nr:glucokinase [Allonocardiopsis opalescens]
MDIGGTKVAAGVVDRAGRVRARARSETPDRSKSPKAVEDTITAVVDELRRSYEVAAVGVGAAGFVDEAGATVLFAPHLAWRGEPLRDRLRERLGLTVVLDNDANAAAWAEYRLGSARGRRDVLCVTLGTGIGGALIVGGALYRGRYGTAGEFGHMVVMPGGHRCECGNRGCWEQYASGNALVREARELARTDSPVARQLLDAVAGDPDQVTGPLVTRLALAGDPAAAELLDDVGTWLGRGLANLAAAFDPALFVVGGGVSDAGDLLLGPARLAFRRALTGRGYRPEASIVRASFGNEAGLVGAAILAREAALGAAG